MAGASTDKSPAQNSSAGWLNRTVLGVGVTSLFSDWSHEIATAVLPAFLAAIGAGPAWLGAIEGIADGTARTNISAIPAVSLRFGRLTYFGI